MYAETLKRGGSGEVTQKGSPVTIYTVVGFEAPWPHPRRYIYRACPVERWKDRLCLKSLELESQKFKCDHNRNLEEGIPRFRFRLILEGDKGEIRGTIFQAAETLLGLSPSEFFLRTEKEQDELVEKKVIKPNLLVTAEFEYQRDNLYPIITDLDILVEENVKRLKTNSDCQDVDLASPSMKRLAAFTSSSLALKTE